MPMAQREALVRIRPKPVLYDQARVIPFATLIDDFLRGSIPVDEFESRYLRQYKDDPTRWPKAIYEPLNEVFLDLDAYCPDPELRAGDPYAIDEAELRRRVAAALAVLRDLVPDSVPRT